MSRAFDQRINRLAASSNPSCMAGGKKGVEKESLRVERDGLLSTRPHPKRLGSALTNRFITTDFSEALLEFVTPAFTNTWETLQSLCDIHQFTYANLEDELLWVTSMPCVLRNDREVPLAQYGTSNVGRMKTIYRNGLGYRYGREMQTIAGIHFNYSLPETFWPVFQALEENDDDPIEFRSAAYLGLVRNVRRYGWLILYLTGTSPALCKSFAGADAPPMPSYDDDTYFQPFGTSLRMSDLGYSNSNQAAINISLNSVDEYVRDLSAAMETPEPAFEAIGTKVDGEWRQLSVNKLQIENEYYSPVRPKRVAMSGERPTAALQRGGIEYVEIRSLDLNSFDPVGISQNTMRFIEAFLVYCLLEDSPYLDASELDECSENHSLTATKGRDPELRLQRDGKETLLATWASEIIDKVEQIAALMDGGDSSDSYVAAVGLQRELVADPERTPSARLLQDLAESGQGFVAYAHGAAESHKEYFSELERLPEERWNLLADEATASLARQADIEASDKISLDEYLANWFS